MNDQKDLGVSAITPPRFPLQSSAEDGERISTPIADAKTKGPDVLTIVALRKSGLSDQWVSIGWKRMDPDGVIVRLKSERVLAKGKNKGKRVTFGEQKEVLVTYVEALAAELEWEAHTGKCSKCGGDGQQWAGTGIEAGVVVHRYRNCSRCESTGVAPIPHP